MWIALHRVKTTNVGHMNRGLYGPRSNQIIPSLISKPFQLSNGPKSLDLVPILWSKALIGLELGLKSPELSHAAYMEQ